MFTATTPLIATTAAALTVGALGFSSLADAPAEPGRTDAATVEPATTPAPPAEPAAARTVAIDCGGYDADGAVVNAAATRITSAPVDQHGVPEIPAVCGGYTADGTFIGDD